jgi:hypothetical protein
VGPWRAVGPAEEPEDAWAAHRAQDVLFALGKAGNTRAAPAFNFSQGIDSTIWRD